MVIIVHCIYMVGEDSVPHNSVTMEELLLNHLETVMEGVPGK